MRSVLVVTFYSWFIILSLQTVLSNSIERIVCGSVLPYAYNFTDEMLPGDSIVEITNVSNQTSGPHCTTLELVNDTIKLAKNLTSLCNITVIDCSFECTGHSVTQAIFGPILRTEYYKFKFNSNVYRTTVRELTSSPVQLQIVPRISVSAEGCTTSIHGPNNRFSLKGGDGFFAWKAESMPDSLEMTNSNLDYEHNKSFDVEVAYENNVLNGSASTRIHIDVLDVDDQNPTFDNDVYYLNITEEDHRAVNVWLEPNPRIWAYDQDTGINQTLEYSIKSADFPGLFNISDTNGSILVTRVLDRETANSHHIIIQATQTDNSMRTATATVMINVLDIDDHAPTFYTNYTVSVTEHSITGTIVTIVTATDDDKGINADFTYTLYNDTLPVDVDGDTGTIRVKDKAGFDREKYNDGILSFQVGTIPRQPAGLTGNTATVVIRLADINDHRPTFAKSQVYVFTLSDAKESNIVFKASDEDAGQNAEITYSLVPESSRGFTIDGKTGVISYTETQGYTTLDIVTLHVLATDGGLPPLQITESVYILPMYQQLNTIPIHTPLNKTQVENVKSHMEQAISSITGVPLSIHEIQQEYKGSTLQMKCQNGSLSIRDVLGAVTRNYLGIVSLFYNMINEDTCIPEVNQNDTFGPSEVGLVIVSVILVAVIVLAAVFPRKTCRRRSKVQSKSMPTRHLSNENRSEAATAQLNHMSDSRQSSHDDNEMVSFTPPNNLQRDSPSEERQHLEIDPSSFQAINYMHRSGDSRVSPDAEHFKPINANKYNNTINKTSGKESPISPATVSKSDQRVGIKQTDGWTDGRIKQNVDSRTVVIKRATHHVEGDTNDETADSDFGSITGTRTSEEINEDSCHGKHPRPVQNFDQERMPLSHDHDERTDSNDEIPVEPDIDYTVKSVRISDQVLDLERNKIIRIGKPNVEPVRRTQNRLSRGRTRSAEQSKQFLQTENGEADKAQSGESDMIRTMNTTQSADISHPLHKQPATIYSKGFVYSPSMDEQSSDDENHTELDLQVEDMDRDVSDECVKYLPCDDEISIPNGVYFENDRFDDGDGLITMHDEQRMFQNSKISDV